MDGNTKLAKQLTTALESFFHEGANAQNFRAGDLSQAHQSDDGLARGEEVVDDEDGLFAEVFRRDNELNIDAFGMAGSDGDVDLRGHGDGLFLAGVNHGQVEVFSGHEGGCDAGDFSGENFFGTGAMEDAGKFFATGVHERGVNLMIDKAINFENAIAEVFAIFENALF